MPQRGNILFLILLAVVLFAALSYAVTSSTRGGGNDVSDEKAKTEAAQIMQFGTLMENTVMRLLTSGNCSDSQITFSNTVYKTYAGAALDTSNPNSPPDKHCQVFDQAGGGVSAQVMPANTLTSPSGGLPTAGHVQFLSIKWEGVGTSAPDLVMRVPFLNAKTCQQIDQAIYGSNAILQDGIGGWAYYNGGYSGTGVIGDEEPMANSRRSGCFQWPGGGLGANDIHYYHVLIAR